MTDHTPLNPGFRGVPENEWYDIYRDIRLLDPITAAEAVRITAEFRKLWPHAPKRMKMQTVRPEELYALDSHFMEEPELLGELLITNTVTTDQIPERITRCHNQGEQVMVLMMPLTKCSLIDVTKGQDDWWWVMSVEGLGLFGEVCRPAGNRSSYYYKCDQLPGLLALISRIAGRSKT